MIPAESRLEFSGYVFGSSNQFDYVDSSLIPSPNNVGNFKVNYATGAFTPALTNILQIGTIRDFHEGNSSGLITQSAPLFDGSDDPSLYVSDLIGLSIPNYADFSFELQTISRTVKTEPNPSNPENPFILDISSILTGTIINYTTGEVGEAIAFFNPNVPSGVSINQLTPDTFLGPISYDATLQVVDENYEVSDLYTVDFETTASGDKLLAGTELTSQYDSLSGLTISTPRDEFGAMVFDSISPTGNDYDLATENRGNVLILSEDGDTFDPDDASQGGTVRFQWSNDVVVTSVEFLDIDSPGGSIAAYSDDGSLLRTVAIPDFGDNSVGQVDINTAEVGYLDINLVGSGAITELSFSSLLGAEIA